MVGLQEVSMSVSGLRGEKVKVKVMEWLEKMVFPVKKLWTSASSRVKPRKTGDGLLKLQDDIQTCGYQDVQIMWEMLSRTEPESIPRRLAKQRPFWRRFVWSHHNTSSSFST